ncbi:MAG: response regulator [Planctomycetaceae bacterium]|nr:response regulator [Planctomycetaceae bacterium]
MSPSDSICTQHRLLIVDDDSTFRATVREILAPRYTLLEAASGEEALELVESEPIDLALLDMHMRVLTGLETLRILKQSHATIHCVLVTADWTPELEAAAVEADAWSVLSKPVTRRKLVTTLAAAIQQGGSDTSHGTLPLN